jgi:hypothetical protein
MAVVKPAPPRPAQVGELHLGKHRFAAARDRRAQRRAGRPFGREQGIAATDIVVDAEVFGRPVGERRLRANQLADALDALARQPGQRLAIDQQRRPLIAHAGARRGVDADQPVFGDLAALDPQLVAQPVEQFAAAQHAIGDVVREQHPVATGWRQMEERVETGDAFDLRPRQPERPGDGGQRRRRQIADDALRLAQDLHQLARLAAVTVDDRPQQRVESSCVKAFFAHRRLPLRSSCPYPGKA